jgi:tetratricopeptide (TPR) repeat protein
MEDDKYGLSHEEEIKQVVQRFERMKKNNENYFFDVIEFESIIDYYLESNNQVNASEAAAIAAKQHPNSVSIQLRKARVLLEKGRAVETLKILRKLESIEPGNHEIYIAKGTALGMLGDVTGAKKMFDFALTLDSDDVPNILFSITSILQNLNYYEALIPYLQKLMELEPDFQAHLYDLAYAYEKIEDFENSIKYYKQYLDDEPYSDSAWYNLGIIYNKSERYEEALEAYDYALAINDQNTFALFNKGNILSNLERHGEAIHIYHEFLEIEPDNYEAMTYLAECYEKSGEPEMARKYYLQSIDLAPEVADPWFGLGVISLGSGDIDESFIYLRKALRFDDENPEIWFFLGKAHYLNREIKAAVKCFREALKLDAYFDEIWIELGKIIIAEDLTDKALPYLRKAHKITGDIPGINYLIAVLLLQKGMMKDSYNHLSAAITNDVELFEDFRELLPGKISNDEIRELLTKYGLL